MKPPPFERDVLDENPVEGCFPSPGHWHRQGELELGEDTITMKGVIFDLHADIHVGRDCWLMNSCQIRTHRHGFEFCDPLFVDRLTGAEGHRTYRYSKWIGNHVTICRNAVILPQCRYIGDWAVVGAYSVLAHNVKAGEIWAGSPARKVGERRCK